MSYYIMSDDGQLIERLDSCPNLDYLIDLSQQCECDLWVIEGQHSGITYERPRPEPKTQSKPRLVFGKPIPDDLLLNAPRHKALSLWSTQ